ncbi:MAG: inositol monophosphatase [Holosporales bacterium]|jgi:myo-inositol-1(or 4)-monophosphatase|nr:inositol monophosphatase [Holosporales bacterium]
MKLAAEKASIALIRDFGELEKLQVSRKGFKNFVTAADTRAEERIIKELSRARPSFSFLCEESGAITNDNPDSVWIIDPIDGTTNFMRGIPYFAINIGLMESGTVVTGITLDPMRGDCFSTALGEGTFLKNRCRLRVSGRTNILESVVATHTPPDIDFNIMKSGVITRRTGSVALDLAYVAAGKYDASVAKDVKFWDIAGGLLMIKEAGGFVHCTKTDDDVYDIVTASSETLLIHLSQCILTPFGPHSIGPRI